MGLVLVWLGCETEALGSQEGTQLLLLPSPRGPASLCVRENAPAKTAKACGVCEHAHIWCLCYYSGYICIHLLIVFRVSLWPVLQTKVPLLSPPIVSVEGADDGCSSPVNGTPKSLGLQSSLGTPDKRVCVHV